MTSRSEATVLTIVGTKLILKSYIFKATTSVNMEVSGFNRVIVETNTVPFGF